MKNDIFYMNIALQEAKKSIKYSDVPVGCIIVRNNKIVSKAYNKREKLHNVVKHAEIIAIERACKKLKTWHLNDCILYTTMEPCLMCSGAIIQSRISKLVYALSNESFGEVNNNHYVFKNDKKIIIVKDICKRESKVLLQNFFKNIR